MKKILRSLLVFFCFFLGLTNIQGQKTEKININDSKIESYINEVYGSNKLNSHNIKPHIRKLMYKLLSERVYFIKTTKDLPNVQLLSEQPLFNKYNPNLSKDNIYNPETINPLKYDLPFWHIKGSYFRLDNTSYYLVIKAQNTNLKK